MPCKTWEACYQAMNLTELAHTQALIFLISPFLVVIITWGLREGRKKPAGRAIRPDPTVCHLPHKLPPIYFPKAEAAASPGPTPQITQQQRTI